MVSTRRRRLSLGLGLSLALCATTAASPAAAMIAVSLFRPPLRHAAEVAAGCPDIRNGRYVVSLRIDGEGHGHEAELREAPQGITLWTEECVERAFAAETFPSAGTRDRPVDAIRITFPFVVAGHPEAGAVAHP